MIAGTRHCTAVAKQPGPSVACGCGWSMPCRSYKHGVRQHQHHIRLVRGSMCLR